MQDNLDGQQNSCYLESVLKRAITPYSFGKGDGGTGRNQVVAGCPNMQS